MRVLNIDFSNKITDYGVELLYKKLFDKDFLYNKAFFLDSTTPRKLLMYYSDTEYYESSLEYYKIVDYKFLQFTYVFYDKINPINKIVIKDDNDYILYIENQYIQSQNGLKIICNFYIDRNTNSITSSTTGSIVWNPVFITDYGIRYLYESWINLRNEKINYIYTGRGHQNDLSSMKNLGHVLDDIRIKSIRYSERFCYLNGDSKEFPYNIIKLSEIGLGFYLRDVKYLNNYPSVMDRDDDGNVYLIDDTYYNYKKSLEYDKPVLLYRIKDSDYACIWYSNRLIDEESAKFPNILFSSRLHINLTFKVIIDEDITHVSDNYSV